MAAPKLYGRASADQTSFSEPIRRGCSDIGLFSVLERHHCRSTPTAPRLTQPPARGVVRTGSGSRQDVTDAATAVGYTIALAESPRKASASGHVGSASLTQASLLALVNQGARLTSAAQAVWSQVSMRR
jgi:hypothetical protein